jgi:hypothetical protein
MLYALIPFGGLGQQFAGQDTPLSLDAPETRVPDKKQHVIVQHKHIRYNTYYSRDICSVSVDTSVRYAFLDGLQKIYNRHPCEAKIP